MILTAHNGTKGLARLSRRPFLLLSDFKPHQFSHTLGFLSDWINIIYLFESYSHLLIRPVDLSPVGWDYRIHQGVRQPPTTKECPGYDNKPSDGVAPALDIWRIRSTHSLQLLSHPLWSGMVTLDRFLSNGQIEQTVCKLMLIVSII